MHKEQEDNGKKFDNNFFHIQMNKANLQVPRIVVTDNDDEELEKTTAIKVESDGSESDGEIKWRIRPNSLRFDWAQKLYKYCD